jgi:hypothetical protein
MRRASAFNVPTHNPPAEVVTNELFFPLSAAESTNMPREFQPNNCIEEWAEGALTSS